MLRLEYTTRFKKDMKRLGKRGKNFTLLHDVVEKLRKGAALPSRNRNHRLTGNWKDFWECHIEPDWLLVYQSDPDTLYLAASGSHTDIFE